MHAPVHARREGFGRSRTLVGAGSFEPDTASLYAASYLAAVSGTLNDPLPVLALDRCSVGR